MKPCIVLPSATNIGKKSLISKDLLELHLLELYAAVAASKTLSLMR